MNDEDQTKIQPSSKSKLIYLLPLIFFAGMVLLLFTGLGKDPTILESQLIGKSIPEFEKQRLFDAQAVVTNNDLQGPALLNVFGSWCPACYAEHPYLMDLAASKIVKIYGLNYKDERADGQKFINDLGNPYDIILFDYNGRLGIELGVYGAPETFVINSDNKIIYRHVGVVSKNVWLEKIKPLLFPEEKVEQGSQ